MLRQTVVGVIGLFCIMVGWFFLIPAWHVYSTALLNAGAPLITNDAIWGNITLLAYYLNLLIGLSLIGMGVAIDIWWLIFAWRREVVSDAIEEGEM